MGAAVGALVGADVGALVGADVGALVGADVGALVVTGGGGDGEASVSFPPPGIATQQ